MRESWEIIVEQEGKLAQAAERIAKLEEDLYTVSAYRGMHSLAQKDLAASEQRNALQETSLQMYSTLTSQQLERIEELQACNRQLTERLEAAEKWIRNHPPALPDHACVDCVDEPIKFHDTPNGWRCAYHVALAAAPVKPVAGEEEACT